MPEEQQPPASRKWLTTGTQFLLKDSISGRYYARFWRNRKAVWTSLKTTKVSVAKARLAKELKDHKESTKTAHAVEDGAGTVAQIARVYLSSVQNQVDIKQSTAHYYSQIVTSILKTWQDLKELAPK